MTYLRRILIFQLFVLVLFVGFATADEAKVGLIFPLTGNAALYGEWARRGAELALEESNSRQKRVQIRGVFEDSGGQAAAAVSAYQRLRVAEHVNYISTLMSSPALAISPLANRDRVLLIDGGSTTPAFSSPDDFTFRTGMVALPLVKMAARVLRDDFGAERCVAVVIENEFGEGMLTSFRAAYTGNVASVQYLAQNGADFRPQLLQIRQAGIFDVWAVGHMKEFGTFLRQARELEMKLRIVTDIYSVEGEAFMTAASGAGEGVYYVGPKFGRQGATDTMLRFIEAYYRRFGVEPNYYSAQVYDAVSLIAESIVHCGAGEVECSRKYLSSIDREGASGRMLFDRNGDVQKSIALKKIEGEQFRYVKDLL